MEIKNSIIAIPPGETIKEQLDTRVMNQKDFASRMGLSEKHISQLINGKVPLTQETALKLESVFGVPARFWNNLESLYQEDLARIKQEIEFEKELEILKLIPFKELVEYSFVKATSKINEKITELRRFFESASLINIPEIHSFNAVFRKVDHGKASEFALSAWLQMGTITARSIETKTFDKDKLSVRLDKIRAMNTLEPNVFMPHLSNLLSECGIALVTIPHLPKTYAHGATLWPSKNKAIIMLSLRGKDADKFWFSLFHEIGHIMLHEKNDAYIQFNTLNQNDPKEVEADRFASEVLIPKVDYESFILQQDFSAESVQAFARRIAVMNGIIVGRLQHDGHIPFQNLNGLKTKYVWANESKCS